MAGTARGDRLFNHQPHGLRSRGPRALLEINRGLWGIEIMHRNKDVILGEDGYTNRLGNAPRNIFSLTGFVLKI